MNFTDPRKRRLHEYLAACEGVTVEHLLAVYRLRMRYRETRMWRMRERRRHVEKNEGARRFSRRYAGNEHAGEGPLHALLRELGWTRKRFCEEAGISSAAFNQWDGHPLHRWPVAFLEQRLWAQNMAKFLAEKGWDPAQFWAKGLPPTPGNRTPRTQEQFDALIAGLKGEEK